MLVRPLVHRVGLASARMLDGSECQYDEPPGLDEYEKFLAYDLLSEALGQVGVLAPIRYEHPPRTKMEKETMRGFM